MSLRLKAGNDKGAIAVMSALLVVLLLSVGALAVDLGNAWERKRQAQTSADLAALAGAAYLPDQVAAFNKALEYIQIHNLVPSGAILAGDLRDGSDANGEIATTPTTVRVQLPPRTVQFGLAAVMGFSSTTVTAVAVAEIRSPAAILPVFLPYPCPNGQETVKDNAGSSTTYVPAGDNKGVGNVVVTPGTITFGASSTVTITGSGLPAGATGVVVGFTLGAQNIWPVAPSSVSTTPNGKVFDVSLTVDVPSAVFNTVGAWRVRIGYTDTSGNDHWTPDNPDTGIGTLNVVAPAGTCGTSSTGDFGFLDSPRRDGTPNADWIKLNILKGIDHDVAIHPIALSPNPPSVADALMAVNAKCSNAAGNIILIPGSIPDNTPVKDGANCLDINSGNKVDVLGDGLITGAGGLPGRLAVPPATTSCNGTTIKLGVTINNDVLSCFLAGTMSLTDVQNGVAASVTDQIFKSPRFFFIPVLNVQANPPNGFYPIREFRAAFITDELPGQPATSDNGLYTSPTKLTALKAFVFPLSALPANATTPGNGSGYVGGTKEVRLVK